MAISIQRHQLAQKAHRGHWEKKWDKDREDKTKEYWQNYLGFLEKYTGLNPDYKILDIGCGPGGLINWLDQGERYGFDSLMDYFLHNFDMPKEIKWLKGHGENLPFSGDFFDLVILTNALDHTRDPRKIVTEVHRVLKKQRFLFLTVDTYPRWVRSIKMFLEEIGQGDPRHPHAFSHNEVKNMLESIGFKAIKVIKEGAGSRSALSSRKKQDSIPLKPKNKIAKALETRKKQGYRGLFRAFLGFFILRLFRGGRFFPKKNSIFIVSKI